MKTLVIVPAYNEAESIEKVIRSLWEECPATDFVVVNDGSSDGTAEICRSLDAPLLNLPVNLGLSGAFQTGMRYAFEKGYDAAIQFDADGQHDVRKIQPMIQRMEESGADIIIGSRFTDCRKPNSMRMLGSRLLSFVIRLTTGQKVADPTSGMRLYGPKVLKQFASCLNYGPEPDTVAFLIRQGAKVEELQVEMHEREAGQSYLTAAKSARYMMNMFVSILLVQFFRKGEQK